MAAANFRLWDCMLGFTRRMWGGALAYCPCVNYKL